MTPTLQWDTLHEDGGNLIIHTDVQGSLHIIVLPREVLEDALQSLNEEPMALARANTAAIDDAVRHAWDPDRLRHMFEIGGPGRNVQLWLEPRDFS